MRFWVSPPTDRIQRNGGSVLVTGTGSILLQPASNGQVTIQQGSGSHLVVIRNTQAPGRALQILNSGGTPVLEVSDQGVAASALTVSGDLVVSGSVTIQGELNADAIDQTLRNDLASTQPGKGASLVGISSQKFTATNVEGALVELKNLLDSQQAEIQAARGQFSNLDARLDDMESRIGSGGSGGDGSSGGGTGIDQGLRDALASSEGAGMIGFSSTRYTATTVKDALEEAKALLDAHDSEIRGARGQFSSLGQRLADLESRADSGQGLRADLSSTQVGKGASLIGIADVNDRFAATTVEGALDEAKLLLDQLRAEVEQSRGSLSSLAERLAVSLHEDGTLKTSAVARQYRYVFQAAGGETVVSLPPEVPEYEYGNGTLLVFVNGILQAPGLHYNEVETAPGSGLGREVDFSPTQLVAGDIVTLVYSRVA